MSWSLNIGKVAGTVVRIHLTFLLFLAWIFAASYSQGGAATAWGSVVFMVLLFLCVLLHEFGHIFTARAFGVATPYVTLLPIGGVAQLERIPEEPGQEFLIAIAGPLVNVVITILLVAIGGATLQPNAAAGLDNTQFSLIDRLAAVNLFLALFNMIPAFPMDGGRVLRALLASRMGYVRATEVAAAIGQFVAFALGFIGLMYNPILIFIAIFVYLAASSEAHMVALRAASRGVPVQPRHGDAFRDADARRASRRGGADLAANRPGRIPGGRCGRQAHRRARPRRPDPRHQAARPRRARR